MEHQHFASQGVLDALQPLSSSSETHINRISIIEAREDKGASDGLRHILCQSRPDATYCPDVIETDLQRFVILQSECELTVQCYPKCFDSI